MRMCARKYGHRYGTPYCVVAVQSHHVESCRAVVTATPSTGGCFCDSMHANNGVLRMTKAYICSLCGFKSEKLHQLYLEFDLRGRELRDDAQYCTWPDRLPEEILFSSSLRLTHHMNKKSLDF